MRNSLTTACQRRSKIDRPQRLNIDPGPLLLIIASVAAERSEVVQDAMMETLGMSGIGNTAGVLYSAWSSNVMPRGELIASSSLLRSIPYYEDVVSFNPTAPTSTKAIKTN